LHDLPTDAANYDQLSKSDKHAIGNYINMCSEQFFWHGCKMIDKPVWMVWEAGVKEKFRERAIIVAWNQSHRDDRYYPGFREFVDSCLAT
jgi:hypothetical protein